MRCPYEQLNLQERRAINVATVAERYIRYRSYVLLLSLLEMGLPLSKGYS